MTTYCLNRKRILAPLRTAGSAGAIAVAFATFAMVTPAHAETLVGLTTTNALVTFDSAAPTMAGPAMNITGLLGLNERILGIDLRPATGALYGLGSGGNLYTLNALTGTATFASALTADPLDLTSPFAGLSGTAFGIDFNPVVDRLRITSNTGQNLRMNVSTGNVTSDAALNGQSSSISASAYTNSDNNPLTGTTLFGINGATDMLYLQAPPNDGTLSAVGALGVDTSNATGFDISGATGVAYASLTDGDTGKSSLYSINLGTGIATPLGAFGIGGNTAIAPTLSGIAVAAVPEPETYAMMLAGLLLVGSVARRYRRR